MPEITPDGTPRVVWVGDLVIDLSACRVRVAARDVALRKKEYAVIAALARGYTVDPVRVWSKKVIHQEIYDKPDPPLPDIIEVYICKIRKKLAAASGGTNYIETSWGKGFRLREPAPPDL